MPSSALKLVPAVDTSRPELEPEDELDQLWKREEELRKKLAINEALQVDALRRYREKHRLLAYPRLQTVKNALQGRAPKPELVR